MPRPQKHFDAILNRFQTESVIGINDLVRNFRELEPMVSREAVNWRIFSLVSSGRLERIGRGSFRIGSVRNWAPVISKRDRLVFRKLSREFPFAGFCMWSTAVFNEMLTHQSGYQILMVETARDTTEAVFHYLQRQNRSVFLNPSKELFERYISGIHDVIVIRPLISEAPVQEVDGVITVTIEKILVDLFCEDVCLEPFGGSQMLEIFTGAFERFTVNRTRLLRYASRRNRREVMEDWLQRGLGL